ncbi:hypothetical protein NHX12_021060 [Muraenolepis orangiensis]|uniref:Uncharacterized protein n=1 Tax=Muraenolepis orangiensis TaxID=630683 RepID=A0A9Q0EPS3_9TELE|nr:hypothetical protein NHX12_021060 [Muraenolepis orangiensis]
MGVPTVGRPVLMFLGLISFSAAFALNILAGLGASSGVFKQSTEDVTLKYLTPLTPASWSLFVWDFIYVWLFFMFLYFLAGLCRRGVYEWMYTSPAVLPYGFHVSLLDLPVPPRGLKVYGGWLHTHHPADLWAIRLLVQNGVELYAAWSSISTLMSVSIYLEHYTPTSRCDCATFSLMVLLMELLAWFLLENFYLDEHVRYVLTGYPVVILWLSGSIRVILLTACVMFLVRVPLVTWRHLRRPLYSDPFMVRSPGEIALTQRRVFL